MRGCLHELTDIPEEDLMKVPDQRGNSKGLLWCMQKDNTWELPDTAMDPDDAAEVVVNEAMEHKDMFAEFKLVPSFEYDWEFSIGAFKLLKGDSPAIDHTGGQICCALLRSVCLIRGIRAMNWTTGPLL